MGKQRTKDIDLSAFDEAVAPKEIDLSVFDNEVKKKSSPQPSRTTGGNSVIGSDNPLNPAVQRNVTPFNFAQQQDPDVYNKVQAQKQQATQAQSNRLKEIQGVYDATQGQGTSAAIQEALVQRDQPKPTTTESMGNSLSNMANRLKGTIPRLKVVAADTWENILGKELANKWYELEGRDIDEVRNEAYADLDELVQQVKPTMGMVESIQNNNWKGVAAATVNAMTSLGSTAIPALATGGAGLFTEMTGDALVDFNEAKAKKLGIPVNELYKQDKADFAIPATIGALSGALELYGMKGVKNLITDKIKGQGFKKALLFFGETQKEGLTEFVQTGLEEANRAMGEGYNAEEATKRAVDKMFSKQGLESYLQGVVGAGVAGGMGKLSSVLTDPKAKSQFQQKAELADELQTALTNSELNPQSRSVIEAQFNNTITEAADIIEKDIKAENKLSPAQTQEVEDLNTQLNDLNAAFNDPNIPQGIKDLIAPEIKTLEDHINEVISKPAEKVTETKSVIKKPTDVQVDDTIELEDGKRGKVSGVEGNMISIQLENGATLTANPSFVEMNVVRPLEAVESTETIEPTQITTETTEVINKPPKTEQNESETRERSEVQSSRGLSEEVRSQEPSSSSRSSRNEEVRQNENAENGTSRTQERVDEKNQTTKTEGMAEEVVSSKRTEEVLAKAEDDLKALKQVQDKTKKYEASIKRLTEAKKNKEITVAEFNDLKKRFDDVIGESTPKTKEETNNATESRKIEQGDLTEREGTNGQQQGKQEDRQHQEATDQGTKGKTSRGDSVLESREEQEVTPKDKATKIQEKRQSIKDRISQKLKDQRGNLSSGFDPSLLSDFVELGSTYIEEGIVKASDFIKRFREDYKDMGFDDKELSDEDITEQVYNKLQPKETVKPSKNVESLDRLAHQNIEGSVINETTSNQAREKGREFTQEEKEYIVQHRLDALNHGQQIVDEAKNVFGDNYVSELLSYVDENSNTLGVDKKQLIYVSLENDLNKQLLADPENLTLKKQEKLVADKSRAFGRETGRALAMGSLRQLARIGYDLSQLTDDFFSSEQLTIRKGIEKAVQATSEDVTQEAITQEQETTQPVTNEKIVKAREEVKKAKEEFSAFLKRSRGQFSSGANVADFIAQAAKLMKAYAKLGIVRVEEVLSEMRKDYGEDFVKKNEENLRKAHESILSNKQKVRQTLIDAGYSREITVNTKNGKVKRSILDWKKLTGEEGSLDNINVVLDRELKGKGYSESEIESAKKALKDEYNDLHASIIEKSINELNKRNTLKPPVTVKDDAKRLAELYNYGLFEKEADTYDNLLNSALGLSGLEQKAFNEAKEIARSMAQVLSYKSPNGKPMNELAVKKAIVDLQAKQEALLTKVANANSSLLYKVVDTVGEFIALGQRFVLARLGQVIENPLAGYTERAMLDVGDRITEKNITPEMRKHNIKLANAQFRDITLNAGGDFGNVGSPFLIKSKMMDKLINAKDNKLYHVFTSIALGRAYLEGADSMHKIALTQRAFTISLIKILKAKGMSHADATNTVSVALTGQSFEDAKATAKQLIEDVNEKAGKEMLSAKDESVTLLANDIVKNSLIEGGLVTDHELKSAYRAAYKIAGLGMGHEANNFISSGVKYVNQNIQGKLDEAIKNKDWAEASAYRLGNVFFNNILNPFVGGGTNWTVLTATKMGVNPLGYINLLRRKVKIDPTTIDGQRKLQENLIKSQARRNDAVRTLAGAAIGLSLYAITRTTGADDDLQEWLKKNKWAQPYFNKASPPALGFIMAMDNKAKGEDKAYKEWWANTFNVREVNYFDDVKKMAKAVNILNPQSEKEYNEAMGALGELTIGKINAPVPSWGIVKQSQNIIRGLEGLPPISSDYSSSGFFNGGLRGGFMEYIGLRPKANLSIYDVKSGKEVPLTGQKRIRYENMLSLLVADEVEKKEKELAKLSPSERQSAVKTITTKASKKVLDIMSGINDNTRTIRDDDKVYELSDSQIKKRLKINEEFIKEYGSDLKSDLIEKYMEEGMNKKKAEIEADFQIQKKANAYSKNEMIGEEKDKNDGKVTFKEKE